MTGAALALRPGQAPGEDVDLVVERVTPGEVHVSSHGRRPGHHPETISGGGVGTAMLDVALAAAVQSFLAPGRPYLLVDFAVTMVRAESPLDGRLEATARVVRSGGGLLVATGHVRAAGEIRVTGRLVARVPQAPVVDEGVGLSRSISRPVRSSPS